MTKQEKTREELWKVIRRNGVDISRADALLKEILQVENELGVVIKTNRELPKFAKNWDEDGHIFHDAIFPVTREDLAKAGYEAVENLI